MRPASSTCRWGPRPSRPHYRVSLVAVAQWIPGSEDYLFLQYLADHRYRRPSVCIVAGLRDWDSGLGILDFSLCLRTGGTSIRDGLRRPPSFSRLPIFHDPWPGGRGAVNGDVFVVGAIGLLIAIVATFIFFPVTQILASALRDERESTRSPSSCRNCLAAKSGGCTVFTVPSAVGWPGTPSSSLSWLVPVRPFWV